MAGRPQSGPSRPGRSRPDPNAGANGVQRSFASQLKEREPLFTTYEHLSGLSRGDDALKLLRKVASIVKPIMRKRGWRVQVLAEFLPAEANLLGLNINSGYKICIRLRYPRNPDLFLPFEELVDTMLHELSHNVWGEHDSNFHRLWDELRDEHETLVRKGYTGEGFLSEGRRLGGFGNRMPPPNEMRRLARASAEKRKAQGTLSQNSGRKLGGVPLHLYGDARSIIANQATRRNTINQGCASGRQDAGRLSDQSASSTFKTKAEEDDANDRAIAQALYELMEQEEEQKLMGISIDSSHQDAQQQSLHDSTAMLSGAEDTRRAPSEEDQVNWAIQESMRSSPAGAALTSERPSDSAPPVPLHSKPPAPDHSPRRPQGVDDRTLSANPESLADSPSTNQWACEVCTCLNPTRYLACDACGVERARPTAAAAAAATKTKSSRLSVPSGIRPIPKKPSSSTSFSALVSAPKQNDSLGWTCTRCGAFMEHKWWTCSACGLMKSSS